MMMKQETSCIELFLLPVMLNFNELNDVLFPFENSDFCSMKLFVASLIYLTIYFIT